MPPKSKSSQSTALVSPSCVHTPSVASSLLTLVASACARVTAATVTTPSSIISLPQRKSTPGGNFSTNPQSTFPFTGSESILTSTSGISIGAPTIPCINRVSPVSLYSVVCKVSAVTRDCKQPLSRSIQTLRCVPELEYKHAS